MGFYDYGYGDYDGLFDNPDFVAVLSMIIGFILVFVVIIAAVRLVLYILRSIGLYKLAVNRGMGGAGLAWIPYVGFYRIGSIADDISARNGEKSYYRYILLIGGIIGTISSFVQGGMIYPSLADLFDDSFASDYFAGSLRGYSVFSGLNMIMSAFSLALFVLTVVALNKVYKCYRPMSSTSWTVLSVIFPFMQSIFPFAIRNSVPIPEWGSQGYYAAQNQDWQAPPPPQYTDYGQQPPANGGYYPPQYGQGQPQQYMPPPSPPMEVPYQPPAAPDTIEPPPMDAPYQPPVAPNPPEPWEISDTVPPPPPQAPWEKNDANDIERF